MTHMTPFEFLRAFPEYGKIVFDGSEDQCTYYHNDSSEPFGKQEFTLGTKTREAMERVDYWATQQKFFFVVTREKP